MQKTVEPRLRWVPRQRWVLVSALALTLGLATGVHPRRSADDGASKRGVCWVAIIKNSLHETCFGSQHSDFGLQKHKRTEGDLKALRVDPAFKLTPRTCGASVEVRQPIFDSRVPVGYC